MARYPGARWRPIEGHTDGPMRSHLGAVLHVNQSDGNLWAFFDNARNEVSSHFEVYKNGAIEQYLDTNTDSWCQMAGNETYVSIETEGYATEPLTRAQVDAIARLYAWLHKTHNIPFQLANEPGQRGFGWHGMGGAAWGGHYGCPGAQRRGQRLHILGLAAGHLATEPDQEITMDAEVTKAFQDVHAQLTELKSLLSGGRPRPAGSAAAVGVMLDGSHEHYANIERYLEGIPGYRSLAYRLARAARKTPKR